MERSRETPRTPGFFARLGERLLSLLGDTAYCGPGSYLNADAAQAVAENYQVGQFKRLLTDDRLAKVVTGWYQDETGAQ